MFHIFLAVALMQSGQASSATDRTLEAGRSYFECLSNAASEYDDDRSDAASIATAIIPQCQSKFELWKIRTQLGVAGHDQEKVGRDMEARRMGEATAAVLSMRRLRRELLAQPK